ncbi:hypothetical protein Dimus_013199, partial [Dionaea muscipula]
SEIELNMKITMTEGNLGRKIDENSSKLSNVERTLAELLKAQKEQNKTNKALTHFLGKLRRCRKSERSASGLSRSKKGKVRGAGGSEFKEMLCSVPRMHS